MGFLRKSKEKKAQQSQTATVAPILSDNRNTPGASLQADMAQVQNGTFDNETIDRLQRSIGNQAIQRLVSYKDYKKSTKAKGRRSHIRPLDKAFKLYKQLEPTLPGKEKAQKLKELIELADIYLNDTKRQDSKRRPGVMALKTELQDELSDIQSAVSDEDFDNTGDRAGSIAGGQIASSLDLVEYGFGIMHEEGDDGVTTDVKVEGDTFTGAFKENEDSHESFGRTRAVWTGMENGELNLAKRNVATYELSKLFDNSLIPPTFLARMEKNGEMVEGSVMEYIGEERGQVAATQIENPDYDSGVGYSWTQEEIAEEMEREGLKYDPRRQNINLYETVAEDPTYRQGVSKLMMFDFIAGQVDRHQGNFIIEMQDGVVVGVKGIDNDMAFGDQFTDMSYTNEKDREEGKDFSGERYKNFGRIAGTRVQDLEEIDQKLAERIIQVAGRPELVRDALEGLLTDSEIDATISRLNSLADFLQPLLQQGDGRIVSEWR